MQTRSTQTDTPDLLLTSLLDVSDHLNLTCHHARLIFVATDAALEAGDTREMFATSLAFLLDRLDELKASIESIVARGQS